jgi:hypothetical protein
MSDAIVRDVPISQAISSGTGFSLIELRILMRLAWGGTLAFPDYERSAVGVRTCLEGSQAPADYYVLQRSYKDGSNEFCYPNKISFQTGPGGKLSSTMPLGMLPIPRRSAIPSIHSISITRYSEWRSPLDRRMNSYGSLESKKTDSSKPSSEMGPIFVPSLRTSVQFPVKSSYLEILQNIAMVQN